MAKIVNGTLPASPTTGEEVIKAFSNDDVKTKYGTSLQNGEDIESLPSTDFYQHTHECKAFSYTIFASQNVINGIKTQIPVGRRKFAMDATFKVCPYGIFNQLLIIHVEHLDEVRIFISFRLFEL